ncbi:MAG: hypothetical protein ACE5FS_08815 [Paracoccaceae bacterium]
MRRTLRQTIFAAGLLVAGVYVIWIFYYLGELAYGVFSIPILPNRTVDFIVKNLLIFAILGSVDRIVDFGFTIKNKVVMVLFGVAALATAYFLVCFYFYIFVQAIAASYDFVHLLLISR